MFKTDKVVFKKLNKMPITKRIEVASSPQGSSVLAALTPTEFAELFPRYYQRGLPDVGGFRAATTAAAQKRQSEASASILDRLTKAEQGAEAYASQVYHQLKRKLGLETEKQPELSPEQAAAFDKVRSGPIAVSSDEGKVFSRLDDKKLESIGITRTKDNTGRDVYEYTQPQVGVEEAKARLQSGGSANQKALELIRKREGFIPEAKFDVNHYRLGYGSDTITKADGTVIEVKPGMRVTREDAERDLLRRMPEFQRNGIIKYVGEEAWNKLNAQTKASLTSLAYNYGSIGNLDALKKAIISGNKSAIANAIDSYQSHNGGVNAGRRAEEANLIRSSTDVPDVPAPENKGQYSDAQVNKMMDQLREEKNAARKQQLANILSDAGVDTATINSISQVKTSGVVGKHFGEGDQCVALSKHFAPQIGPASKWQFNEGTGGIVPGAVIATRRYADGSGGKMASQMPDGKSHYHTGIALTRPDAQGNVLIFDQAKSYGSKITKVNIKDYHGETWGVVKGGEPTSKSMEAVNIALSRANDSEKAAITESMRGSAPKTATSTGQLEASVDVGPAPIKPVNQEGQPLPPQQQAPMQQPGAPQEPAPQVKADAPPPAPKIQPVKYKFNEQTFLQEVRAKSFGAGLVSDEYIMGETLKGFKETAGVKYDRKTGTLTIDDPNSPAIKEIVAKMRENNLDEKVFLNKMKEEKPATPTPTPEIKPKEQTPVPPPPEKKAETPAPTPPAQAPAPTPTPEPPKVEAKPTQEPPKVPGASDGGSFDVGDRGVAISPMDKRDDKAVIDTKTQQPLFTVKSGERINVTPQQKVDGIAPAQDNIRNEINALRQEMGNSFADAGGRMSPMQMTQIRSSSSDNPNFVDRLTKQNVDPWNNPVMERAMNRTRLQETGDSLNNHFSYGNTNS
jgi:GH24 family phage-related lysozyme (muramidase)